MKRITPGAVLLLVIALMAAVLTVTLIIPRFRSAYAKGAEIRQQHEGDQR